MDDGDDEVQQLSEEEAAALTQGPWQTMPRPEDAEVAPDVVGRPWRVAFSVANLALVEPLSVGSFVITPLPRQEPPVEQSPAWQRLIATAYGIYTLPVQSKTTLKHLRARYVGDAERLHLLLSFARNSHVPIFNAQMQEPYAADWKAVDILVRDRYLAYPRRGLAWYGAQEELWQFLEHAWPRMADQETAEKIGLRLALYVFNRALGEPVTELRYLQAWMAIELLVSRSAREEIVPPNVFSKVYKGVKQKLRENIEKIPEEKWAAFGSVDELVDDMSAKLPELNRPSIATEAVRYINSLFDQFAEPPVTKEDIQTLGRIRNLVAHTGVLRRSQSNTREEGNQYIVDIEVACRHVQNLSAHIIMALLGLPPRLALGHWKNQFELDRECLSAVAKGKSS